MIFDYFLCNLENNIGKIKRKTKSTEKVLDEVEELYTDSINGIDEMLRWLNYYKRDPENPQYNPTNNKIIPDYKLVSLNNAVHDAPKIVREPYKKFRKEKPLITGNELPSNMRDRNHNNEWTRFCKTIKSHENLLIKIKNVLNEGLDDIKESKKELKRQKYNEKSANQRGKSVNVDLKNAQPEITPDKIQNRLSKILDEELSEKENINNLEDDEKDDENIPLMEPRQFVHYLVEYLKHERHERSDYYWTLRKGFPKQAKKIESKVYSINDIHNIGDDDDMRPLSPEEIKYIKDRVIENKPMTKTLEMYKEK